MNLASLYEADRERFPALAKLEKHGIAVGAYLRMIDGVYAALEGVEEHWGLEYDGDYRFRWVHSYWCAAAVVYYLYRFFEPLKSWPESVQKWFDADETETQNQLYLKSAEDYAAKQDAEIWDYKNLRREMGCAVDELVRAVEPVEIEIEVTVEKPRETALAKDVRPVEAQNNSDIPF